LNPKPQQVIQSIKRLAFQPSAKKNFSEMLPSNSLGPGSGEVGQGGLKVSTYDATHKKCATPNQKNFFHCTL